MMDAQRVTERIEAEAWVDFFRAAPPAVREPLGLMASCSESACTLRSLLPTILMNRVFCIDPELSDAALDALVEPARCVQAREGSPLVARLAHRGLLEPRAHGAQSPPSAWAELVYAGAPPARADTALDVREVHGADEAARWASVVCRAHGMPPVVEAWTAALVGRARWRAYAVYDGPDLVAGGVTYLASEGAWLGLGGTLPSSRRRGAQAALIATRVRDAIGDGAPVVTSETGDPGPAGHNASLSNLVRAGFRVVARRVNLVRG